jgi:hypothetical protein
MHQVIDAKGDMGDCQREGTSRNMTVPSQHNLVIWKLGNLAIEALLGCIRAASQITKLLNSPKELHAEE